MNTDNFKTSLEAVKALIEAVSEDLARNDDTGDLRQSTFNAWVDRVPRRMRTELGDVEDGALRGMIEAIEELKGTRPLSASRARGFLLDIVKMLPRGDQLQLPDASGDDTLQQASAEIAKTMAPHAIRWLIALDRLITAGNLDEIRRFIDTPPTPNEAVFVSGVFIAALREALEEDNPLKALDQQFSWITDTLNGIITHMGGGSLADAMDVILGERGSNGET